MIAITKPLSLNGMKIATLLGCLSGIYLCGRVVHDGREGMTAFPPTQETVPITWEEESTGRQRVEHVPRNELVTVEIARLLDSGAGVPDAPREVVVTKTDGGHSPRSTVVVANGGRFLVPRTSQQVSFQGANGQRETLAVPQQEDQNHFILVYRP